MKNESLPNCYLYQFKASMGRCKCQYLLPFNARELKFYVCYLRAKYARARDTPHQSADKGRSAPVLPRKNNCMGREQTNRQTSRLLEKCSGTLKFHHIYIGLCENKISNVNFLNVTMRPFLQ